MPETPQLRTRAGPHPVGLPGGQLPRRRSDSGVRGRRHLGMSLDLRDQKVPSLADAITINRRVRSLVEKLDGSLSPSRLRYVDKTLMDISSRGLIKSEAAVETTAS